MVKNAEPSPKEKLASPESPKARESGIAQEVDKFVNGTASLVATAPLSLWAVDTARRSAYKEHKTFVHSKCVNIRKEGKKTLADIPLEHYSEYRIVRRRFDRSTTASKIIANSSVVSLVSEYDSFLGGLLRALFRFRPDLLNESDRTLTLKELQTFESIDAARDFIVEKEVETVVRKGHVEQFEWMENRFVVRLREGLAAWPTFVEVTERRNLLVHRSGIASLHYLSVCRQHGIDCTATIVGTELTVTRAYLLKAYECLVEIGVKLAHVLWRKLLPEERADADESLNSLCLDLMLEGRNGLARSLLDFATGVLKKWSTEVNRLLFVINRAQAYKWLGDESTCQKILSDEDWSAVDDKLSLGVAVLKDNFEAAAALMRKVGGGTYVNKDGYREWPIFKQFRKTAQFTTAYKEIFDEDFADVPEHDTVTFQLDFGQEEPTKKILVPDGTSNPN
jgi:hypothetical protein